jgi:hypothetical protein
VHEPTGLQVVQVHFPSNTTDLVLDAGGEASFLEFFFFFLELALPHAITD